MREKEKTGRLQAPPGGPYNKPMLQGDTGVERPRGMSKVTHQEHWHWQPQQLPS